MGCCGPCAKSCGFMAFLVISCVIAVIFGTTAVAYFVAKGTDFDADDFDLDDFLSSTEYKFLLAMLAVGLAFLACALVFAIVAMCCKGAKGKKGEGKEGKEGKAKSKK